MPTKKARLGFIPRFEVLDLINKLSFECNLSNSKIINVLVEEALYNRGLLKIGTRAFEKQIPKVKDSLNRENIENVNVESKNNFKNNLLKDENININALKEDSLNKEIYDKFLMLLEFQEMMEKRNL